MRSNFLCIILFSTSTSVLNCVVREKGRDLTQSYDKSPYTNRKIQKATWQEQDKSSDIDQQPPFGDRKISNFQPQNRGGGGHPTMTKLKTPQITSITQRLRTDLRRSVGVKAVTQLVWLNRITRAQPSLYPQQPCNQKDTHLKNCK